MKSIGDLKLSYKVSAIIVIVFVVVGTGAAFLSVFINARLLESQWRDVGRTVSAMVQNRLESDMLGNSLADVRGMLSGTYSVPGTNEVVIYDASGSVYASSKAAEVGRVTTDPAVTRTIDTATSVEMQSSWQGNPSITVISPLVNKPQCRCHAAGPPVLGAIEVGLDAQPLAVNARQQALALVGVGVFSLFAVAVLLWLALRRMVVRRLDRLAAVARLISSGDYAARAEAGNGDEVGLITRTFNEMAEAVESGRKDLEEAVERRTRHLAGLVKVIGAVNRVLDGDQALKESLSIVAGIAEADAACVLVEEPGSKAFSLKAHIGLDSGELPPAATGEGDDMVPSIPSFEVQAGVPLARSPEGRSWLVVLRRSQGDFASDARDFLAAVAGPLSVALEKSRMYRQIQQRDRMRGDLLRRLVTAQEEERKRIAREIHDEFGSKLSVVIASISLAKDKLAGANVEVEGRLDMARDMARQAVKDMRQLISQLRPDLLDHLGLIPTLRHYVRERIEPAGFTVTLCTEGMDQRLPPDVELPLFRVLQETLTNAARHSGGRNIAISVKKISEVIEATVSDDGRGFDVELARRQGGWGLRGMEERVAQLGGRLTMQSSAEKGTTMAITVPVQMPAQANEGV